MHSIPHNKSFILVVDDDEGLLLSVKATLVSAGMPEPAVVSDSRQAMDLIRNHDYHLVLLDLVMPYLGGMEILQQLKEEYPTIECIVITAVDEVSSAVEAMRHGAYDYLVKPLQSEKMIIAINNALEKYNLRHGLALYETRPSFSDLKNPEAFVDMIAEDEAMARVFHQAEAAAATDYNLVVTGETGTGKEMVAGIVHGLGDRSRGPFVAVNMGAFNKTLFEDEFFGHARGAYTGARSERRGFFEAAQGGTIFLDEITDLVPELQGKLLRVIQERELYRLGSTEARNIDVRIIAATNRDVRKAISEGRFREDLFYRLNTYQINIPPLRERTKDILSLAHHFLKIHAKKNRKRIHSLSSDLAECLLAYPFPGNVRELENIIATAVLSENRSVLTLASTNGLLSSSEVSTCQKHTFLTLAQVEKQHIDRVLESTGGNRTRAAKTLGIGLRTLQRKLKHGMSPVTRPK